MTLIKRNVHNEASFLINDYNVWINTITATALCHQTPSDVPGFRSFSLLFAGRCPRSPPPTSPESPRAHLLPAARGCGGWSSAWQAAGGSSMRQRKLNYRSCCPLCKHDKSQWYGQLRFQATHVERRPWNEGARSANTLHTHLFLFLFVLEGSISSLFS